MASGARVFIVARYLGVRQLVAVFRMPACEATYTARPMRSGLALGSPRCFSVSPLTSVAGATGASWLGFPEAAGLSAQEARCLA